MTITTELAQRMREAAKQSADAHRDLVGMEVATESFDFIQLATPVNVLALLDALEAKDKQIVDASELTELQRDKIKRLETDLFNEEQLRKVHSSKSFELESENRELKARNDKDFVWRGEEITRLNDELDEAKERIAELEARTEQQPVAYMHHSGQVITREECCDDEVFAICCKVENPLYASASAAKPVTVELPERYEVDLCPTQSPLGDWYLRHDVLAMLSGAGIKIAEATGD